MWLVVQSSAPFYVLSESTTRSSPSYKYGFHRGILLILGCWKSHEAVLQRKKHIMTFPTVQ